MHSFLMIVTAETHNLIPWYLAQVALTIWNRDHIGIVLKTISSLGVHETKYSLHPLHLTAALTGLSFGD